MTKYSKLIRPALLTFLVFSGASHAKKPAKGVSIETWAAQYGVNLNQDLSNDLDKDGLSLLQEYSLLVDPAVNSSGLPKLKIERIKNNEKIELSFAIHDMSQVHYYIESSTDLVNWSEIEGTYSLKNGVGGLKSVLFKSRDKFRNEDRRFFRVVYNID
ncbi:hypothetical protein GW916_15315 [bacterium]|nr:hypothetical protein [bacterium]